MRTQQKVSSRHFNIFFDHLRDKRISILLPLFCLLTFNLSAQQLEVGDLAPDIVLNDVDGNEIRLSSLKGHVVLLDFWASWCRPCRKENPEIVRNYLTFKDETFKNGEGFTVFSVSLDVNETIWKRAIEKDGLIWDYHVSDLKGWDSEAARSYEITSIPQSYLLDGDGRVISVNPRGGLLEKELKKNTKKNRSWFSFFWGA